ncbi:protein kinase, partial [Exiguobacterium sp. BRG2]|uniref:protein kinase domain-containing protein n=1 Tax=Exiguobacterium sp. BRG2 TaxID=2962584 RepID=UPI0028810682
MNEMIVNKSVNMLVNLETIKEIGDEEGRNSRVWLANDTQLNELIVLKGVMKSSFSESEINEYFLETQIMNECKSPNILPVKYAGMDDEYIYMTLPYCKNGSLKTKCDKESLTLKEVIIYALEFLNGLLFLHT